jgi:Protein kinase domain
VPVAPGIKLGQYEVQDFIGQGAMGLVYRAYHTELERTGAVKVMQAITPDPDSVARFRHEAQSIAKLRHPNIVDVYDFGEYQGTPYMIVEYVPGGSLAGRMNGRRLDQATALRYLRGIASGLDYAHEHGIIHRDVKPANVLLSAEDSPVLADFGLAKLLQGSSLKSMTGVTTGTPAYMAPEQVTGSKVGPASDRYSLATIAYEMLTGVIPFDGEALMELLYAQVHREPMAPTAREPSLPPAVDAVVMRGLAKDPAARWSSSTAFVDALEAALKGVAPAPAWAKTMVMPPAVASTVPLTPAAIAERLAEYSSPATVAAKPKRRFNRRWLVGVAAILLLALLMGVCAVAASATTLTLNPDSVAPGGTVAVSATHVPAGQVGEIQLWSILRRTPFRADSNGDVSVDISVPHDIALGDHIVKICWSGTCHKQAPLLVVSEVALAPTPVATSAPQTTPGVTPTPRPSSTPGSTPPPTTSPGATPRSTPTATPTAPPTATPTSAPPPTPYITLVNNSISKTGGFSVVFHYFAGGTWSVSVVQLGKPYGAGSATVPTGSTYYQAPKFTTPPLVVSLQSAYVVACNGSGKCYQTNPVTVGL